MMQVEQLQREYARRITGHKPILNTTAQKSAADFESIVNAISTDVDKKDGPETTKDANVLLDKVDVLE
jgi:hypothetical protein